MSSRLARQSLDLLTSGSKSNTATESSTNKNKQKLKLPKTNRGIQKVKLEIRYGRHKKTRLLQEEKRKKEHALDKLYAEELSAEERMKRNVEVMQKALRSSDLEKKIHQEVIDSMNAKRSKKWSSKVKGTDEDDSYRSN
ncbi:hypothetical protein CU098_013028 [Rhizopus stolonifer]|uniref:Uncharacterized protein n=1 Tax=Rhizopus stolonifer TaxID=4846 RepID=A0A367KUV4_RHIST|nr:hypothetical protein CU098_013028 [Rhizopus stolonifer]